MDPREFELLVEKGLLAIPARFRRRMDNVAVVVEQEGPLDCWDSTTAARSRAAA